MFIIFGLFRLIFVSLNPTYLYARVVSFDVTTNGRVGCLPFSYVIVAYFTFWLVNTHGPIGGKAEALGVLVERWFRLFARGAYVAASISSFCVMSNGNMNEKR